MGHPKIFLPEMTFAEVEDILEHVELAILPTGSNEGHGPHLPLKVNAATSTYVSIKAAEALYPQALVAPTLAVGHSPQHLEFPGSMTLIVGTIADARPGFAAGRLSHRGHPNDRSYVTCQLGVTKELRRTGQPFSP